MALSLDKVQKGAAKKKQKSSKTQSSSLELDGALNLKTSRPWIEKPNSTSRIQKHSSKRDQDISLEEAKELVAPDIREDWLLGAIENLQIQEEVLKFRDHLVSRATGIATQLPFGAIFVQATQQWLKNIELNRGK